MPRILYLHGFCSSPRSSKGTFLAARFAELGAEVTLADLDGSDFENTSLTRQLAETSRLAHDLRPRLIIGSSLGGYVAALHAAREPETVSALVLLAPAFDFSRRLADRLGPAMEVWKLEGRLAFHHYGLDREVPLSHAFFEDAARYERFPDISVPTRILHGKNDETVDPQLSRTFARDRPNVQVDWLDTDHQMLDVTEDLWARIRDFYDKRPTPPGEGG